MKMISRCVLIWGCTIWAYHLQAQDLHLDQIRQQFYLTTLDYKHAFPLMEKLKAIENPTALQLAYMGATEAVLAKPGWNLFAKFHHLSNSKKHFKQAVSYDKKDLEVRFLRLAVEYHIPKYLGYSSNIKKDKKVILENIDLFKMKDLPPEIIDYIIRFSVESGLYNNRELEQLKHALQWP